MPGPLLDPARDLLLAAAGLGAGLVNGVAGGGSLVSFPALLAVGYPALAANVTSTVGIWPGYLGGSAGFSTELQGQRSRLTSLAATVVSGAVAGGILLLTTPTRAFSAVAPYLVLFACLLFAVQPLLARRLRADEGHRSRAHHVVLQGGTFLASAYGAYFGAGLGVVLLGVLGLTIPDRLVRINGLRSVLALVVNTVAALIFVVRAPVAWVPVAVMAGTSLVGGYVGARVSRKVPTAWLRAVVITLGVTTAVLLLVH